MAYTPPARGQANWDDELNNTLEYLRGLGDDAKADAAQARSDAAYAKNKANSYGELDADAAHGYATTASSAATDAQAAKSDAEAAAASVAKGQPNGTAPLDGDTRVPQDNLPAHLTPTELSKTYAGKGDIVVRAVDHGVVADGFVDDAAALASALAATPSGGTLLLPGGNIRITAPLAVSTTGLTIRGNGYYTSRIYADACNGIEIAAGLAAIRIENVEVSCKVRHTVTPNTLIGIKVAGTDASRPRNHVYRDVYVDGFQTSFASEYLWSSRLDNFRAGYCQTGIEATGLSVNNMVTGANISTDSTANSRGILLAGRVSIADATAKASEGWVITTSLINGSAINIEGQGYTHVTVTNCIIDYSQTYGIRVGDNGTNFGGNWTIANNYIAMGAAGGVAAIDLANTISDASNSGNRISGNLVLAYTSISAACTYGVRSVNANAGKNNISGNTIRAMATNDIRLTASTDNIVTGNRCLSAITNNLYMTAGQLCTGNIGAVYRPTADPHVYVTIGQNRLAYGAQAPTTLTWNQGDRVFNILPAVGSPKGWVCTVAGTPGTWVSEGNL